MTQIESHAFHAAFTAAFEGHYSRVLGIVARALAQTKIFSFSPELLQQENPTYRERAKVLTEAHEIMKSAANMAGLEYDASVLSEYIQLMHDMANAIDSGDRDELMRVIEILDRKPFICPEFKLRA
ncbi:hypothetical protein [Pantoea ananatis]|uniref:hypothetical protein n=1 Tax=Pantoea ananas TaxID=553 RepID=UPI001B311AA9|nr:hypothetical protein [Pantoea ananatis]